VQEDYIKDEQKNLKKEYLHAQEEVKRIQSVPLVIGQFLEAVDQNNGIVGSTTGTDSAHHTPEPLELNCCRHSLLSSVESCIHCAPTRLTRALSDTAICPSVCPTAQATGTLAACSLVFAGHQRCADCGPVRGQT